MQGILRVILVAAYLELSTARPRLKTVGVMASVWPLFGSHQAGFWASLVHPKAGHPSPSHAVPLPFSLALKWPEGMNPPLLASPPTRETRPLFSTNIKRLAREKSWRGVQSSGETFIQTSQDCHHNVPHQIARKSYQDHQRFPNRSKIQNMLRWRKNSSRDKRSVTQGAAVQYTGFKDVKFRIQGPIALYLTPTPSGNSLRLSTHHVNHTCFRVHKFKEIATNGTGGLLVMVQAHTSSFLQSTTSGLLTLVNSEAGMATITQIDNRFFRLTSSIGDNVIRIQHVITNLYLQARGNQVSLVSTDPLEGEGMRFYEYQCSTT